MKPTPQAIRAAKALFNGEFLTEEETAEIIEREMGGWRPIEEAQDGIPYITLANGVVQYILTYIREDEWFTTEDDTLLDSFAPTHFRELPTPPTP